MSRPIEKGDIVDVYYVCGGCRYGCKVLHTPQDVGDMWYFEDTMGDIIAQNPCSSSLDFIKKLAEIGGQQDVNLQAQKGKARDKVAKEV